MVRRSDYFYLDNIITKKTFLHRKRFLNRILYERGNYGKRKI